MTKAGLLILFLTSSMLSGAAHPKKGVAHTNRVKIDRSITNRWVRPIVRGILDNEVPESICRQIDNMPTLEYPKNIKLFAQPCKCKGCDHEKVYSPWEEQNKLANQRIKDILKKYAQDACKPVMRNIIQDLANGKEMQFHQDDWGPAYKDEIYFPGDSCLVNSKPDVQAEDQIEVLQLNSAAPALQAYNFAAILGYINKHYPR